MNFVHTKPNQLKRVYVVGSNQHKKRKKSLNSIKGALALFTFLAALGYWSLNDVMSVSGAEIVSPLPVASQSAQVVTASAVSDEQVNSFMKNQVKMNEYIVEWMKTQELINSQVITK